MLHTILSKYADDMIRIVHDTIYQMIYISNTATYTKKALVKELRSAGYTVRIVVMSEETKLMVK